MFYKLLNASIELNRCGIIILLCQSVACLKLLITLITHAINAFKIRIPVSFSLLRPLIQMPQLKQRQMTEAAEASADD
jgi:hypothetical protein